MKQMLCKCILLCMSVIALSSCSWLSLKAESSPHNLKAASVSVPADSIPAIVKPMSTVLLEPSRPVGVNAFSTAPDSSRSLSAGGAALVQERVLLTEDATWRDTVLVKGYVVVAPQATLRIEAGTVVRFAGAGDGKDAARLVVQGRIQAIGTAERPIILTSDHPGPARGDWGGISFVSSEKRNILEHCRIEYAASGIAAAFSTVSLKAVAITRSNIGVLMRDSVVQMAGGAVTESDTGIEVHDSEFELRDATIAAGKNGIIMNRSAVGISSVKISNNENYGILSEDCRIKITSAEISANGSGVRLTGGEGQILTSRFSGNRETALHLSGSRIKVQRCLFINNNQDALRLEDGRSLIWGNAFSGNKGFNLYNSGREDISAMQNWWGSSDRSTIIQKIYDADRDPRFGSVQLFPWLNEKPQLQP